jgi:hypothetical protein
VRPVPCLIGGVVRAAYPAGFFAQALRTAASWARNETEREIRSVAISVPWTRRRPRWSRVWHNRPRVL